VNDLLLSLDLGGWKPLLTALLLPPVPWIALVLLGAWALRRRRAAGWPLVLAACLGLWLSATWGAGGMLARWLLTPPPALGAAEIAQLKKAAAAAPGEWAIVVLGGGRETVAPEYGAANLAPTSIERLRYGIWLSRATGIPLAFSGGVGHGAGADAPEAQVAARIAAQEFGRPIRWLESRSRDTRENTLQATALLRDAGVRHLVVVTHGWHMPRAMRAFGDAAVRGPLTLTAAPMGLGEAVEGPVLRWMPTSEGLLRVRQVLREWLGWIAGA
jgi:uncharacterized SAM-binding protein YcdF (DUF218 family)